MTPALQFAARVVKKASKDGASPHWIAPVGWRDAAEVK
jgi:hypothetical protein